MPLRFLEIVTPVQWIKPHIQEEFGPFALPKYETLLAESLAVLREDQINLVALEVREGMDDAVGRDDGLVLEHQGL